MVKFGVRCLLICITFFSRALLATNTNRTALNFYSAFGCWQPTNKCGIRDCESMSRWFFLSAIRNLPQQIFSSLECIPGCVVCAGEIEHYQRTHQFIKFRYFFSPSKHSRLCSREKTPKYSRNRSKHCLIRLSTCLNNFSTWFSNNIGWNCWVTVLEETVSYVYYNFYTWTSSSLYFRQQSLLNIFTLS